MTKKTKITLVFLIIVSLSVFLRFYQLEIRTIFSYDQEATIIAVKKILVEHRPALIGVRTGVGEMHLAPFYYYLYSLPLIVTRLDPIGLAFFASLIGVFTTIGFYCVGRQMFSQPIGLIAAFLYASSSWLAGFDRLPWNPNGLILVVLILLYSLKKIYQNQTHFWLLLAFSLGLSFSLHFSALFLPPILAILFLLKKPPQPSKRNFFFSLLLFLFFLSPLIIFDLRHNFINSRAILGFFINHQKPTSSLFLFLPVIFINKIKIILGSYSYLFFTKEFFLSRFLVLLLLSLGFLESKKYPLFKLYSLLNLSLIPLGYSFFQGETPGYYFFLIFPIGIFLISFILEEIIRRKFIFSLIVFGFLFINLKNFLSFYPSYDSLWVKRQVVNFILSQQKGQPFHVSYTTSLGTAFGFSYLFEYSGHPPSGKLTDPTYTIIIPFDFHDIKPDKIFYGIGVNLPRNRR